MKRHLKSFDGFLNENMGTDMKMRMDMKAYVVMVRGDTPVLVALERNKAEGMFDEIVDVYASQGYADDEVDMMMSGYRGDDPSFDEEYESLFNELIRDFAEGMYVVEKSIMELLNDRILDEEDLDRLFRDGFLFMI